MVLVAHAAQETALMEFPTLVVDEEITNGKGL